MSKSTCEFDIAEVRKLSYDFKAMYRYQFEHDIAHDDFWPVVERDFEENPEAWDQALTLDPWYMRLSVREAGDIAEQFGLTLFDILANDLPDPRLAQPA